MDIFGGINTVQRGIASSWKRNSIILNNVANVDTPNFKASELQFEQLYQNALNGEEDFSLKRTRPKHMRIGEGEADGVVGIVTTRDTTERMDGNSVDIDKEVTDFAKNTIYYNTLLRKVNGQFNQLRTAIRGT